MPDACRYLLLAVPHEHPDARRRRVRTGLFGSVSERQVGAVQQDYRLRRNQLERGLPSPTVPVRATMPGLWQAVANAQSSVLRGVRMDQSMNPFTARRIPNDPRGPWASASTTQEAAPQGNPNEYELDLLRQRLVEARYAKARRGELIVASSAGYAGKRLMCKR